MNYGTVKYVDKPVSRLVFGTATPILFQMCPPMFSSTDGLEAKRAEGFALLDQVFAAGVNTFDCAAHYGEEPLGLWMKERENRDQIVILTKCAHPNQWRKRVTEYDILSDVHDSLAKLKTDHIDIYMLHRDDPDVPVSVSVELFNKLHNDGIIGAFGASNWTHERIAEANNYALERGLIPFSVSSPNFGLADQMDDPWGGGCVTISGPSNRMARAWYAENNIPVFAYSSLARGMFAGAVKSSEPEKATQVLDFAGIKGYCYPDNFRRLARVEELAAEKGVTVAQISLAWIMNQNLNVFALSSTVNGEQLKSTIAGCDLKLTEAECRWLDLETDHR